VPLWTSGTSRSLQSLEDQLHHLGVFAKASKAKETKGALKKAVSFDKHQSSEISANEVKLPVVVQSLGGERVERKVKEGEISGDGNSFDRLGTFEIREFVDSAGNVTNHEVVDLSQEVQKVKALLDKKQAATGTEADKKSGGIGDQQRVTDEIMKLMEGLDVGAGAGRGAVDDTMTVDDGVDDYEGETMGDSESPGSTSIMDRLEALEEQESQQDAEDSARARIRARERELQSRALPEPRPGGWGKGFLSQPQPQTQTQTAAKKPTSSAKVITTGVSDSVGIISENSRIPSSTAAAAAVKPVLSQEKWGTGDGGKVLRSILKTSSSDSASSQRPAVMSGVNNTSSTVNAGINIGDKRKNTVAGDATIKRPSAFSDTVFERFP
jgi:hypothetical protein